MLIIGTTIEKVCKSLLQKDIVLEIRNKVVKKGKLVLFFQRNFHIVFILDNPKKPRTKFEIPIPFDIETHPEDNLVYFDYRMSALSKKFTESEPYLTLYTKTDTKNKFFNSILTISTNE